VRACVGLNIVSCYTLTPSALFCAFQVKEERACPKGRKTADHPDSDKIAGAQEGSGARVLLTIGQSAPFTTYTDMPLKENRRELTAATNGTCVVTAMNSPHWIVHGRKPNPHELSSSFVIDTSAPIEVAASKENIAKLVQIFHEETSDFSVGEVGTFKALHDPSEVIIYF
jgi:hypothetical protein